MPKVRKLVGNYIDMLEAIYPIMKTLYATEEVFINEYTTLSSDFTSQVLKDLNRDQFCPTNDRTFEEYVSQWMDPSTSLAYNQGNATGAFFSLALQMYILQDPRFEQNQAAGLLDRKENRLAYFHKDNKQNISLAYYDDDGITCGISLDYSTIDPNLWSIALIRNTSAAPEDREMLLISSEELLDMGETGLSNAKDALEYLLFFLKSKALGQQIKDCGLFTKNGSLNLANLKELYDRYQPPYPYNNEIVKRLDAQEAKVKDWQLTESQFTIVKEALENKRQQNIAKLDSWYSTWLYNPALDAADKQSFLRRNRGSIFTTVAALVTLIGFALVLSGVLAPFGIAFMGATELILGAVGAGLAFTATLGSAITVGLNEKRLATYQSEITNMAPTREKIYEKRLTSLTTTTAIEQLPEDEVMQSANFKEQLVRAVLHANFSKEEFEELTKKIAPTLSSLVEQDEVVQVEQNALVDASFNEQIQLVAEIGKDSLSRVVERVIQQEEHAQKIVTREEEQSEIVQTDVPQTVEQADSSTHNNFITVH